MAAHGVRPSKTLGQNFVIDPNTIRKVVALAGLRAGEHVLEIGAGLGSLTLELARVARSVTAIEVDGRLVDALSEVVADSGNVEVVRGDALTLDLGSFGASALVANLPYNIAASSVLRVLETAPGIERLTVMTQREVGERLAAAPGSKTYGATSVLVAYWGTARVAAPVSRRAFYPEPNVDSVVVVVERRPTPPDVDRELLFSTIRAAFAQRRKTVRNSLAAPAGGAAAAESVVAAAGLDPQARPEELSLDDFVAIASELARRLPGESANPAL